MDTIWLQKRGNILIDPPLYLKLGSSRGGGEWVLFPLTGRTSSFSCESSLWIYWWSSTAPISNGISKRFKELELSKLTKKVELFLGFKRFKTELCWGSSPPWLWLLGFLHQDSPLQSLFFRGPLSAPLLEEVPSPRVPSLLWLFIAIYQGIRV